MLDRTCWGTLPLADPDCGSDLQLGEQHLESPPVGFTAISRKAAGTTYLMSVVILHCSCLPVLFFLHHQPFTIRRCRKKTRGGGFVPQLVAWSWCLNHSHHHCKCYHGGKQLPESNRRKPEKRHKQ